MVHVSPIWPFLPSAALPFLPPGHGPIILILGGLAVLAVSVPWSMVSAKGVPHHIPTAVAVPPPAPTTPGKPEHWADALPSAAVRAGLGHTWVLTADPDRSVLLVSDCGTCRHRKGRRRGCESERRMLERAARPILRHARVVELQCRRQGKSECAFEVRRG